MSEFTVRTARPDDYAEVARVTVAAYRADGQLDGTGYEHVLADVAGRAEVGEVLVATDDAGAIAGAVTVVLPGTPYAELSVPGELEFRMLAVDPGAQGRGVGEALVRGCVARAEELASTAIVISVRDFAVPAQRLYGRLGFVRTPDRDWSPLPGVSLLALRLDLAGRANAAGRLDPAGR